MRQLLFALLALFPACAHVRVPAEPVSASLRYTFAATGTFTTSAKDAAGQAVELPEGWPSAALWLRGTVERQPARELRDGSRGHLVRFGEVEEGASESGPWSVSELGGRSVELRTFENGEILDIYEASHIAGTPRYGDVFDVIFFALSPVVPDVAPGESAWRRGSWPFFVGPERGLRTNYTASFSHEGSETGPHGEVLRLPYSGEFEARGQDIVYSAALQARGSIEGTVWLQASNVQVVKNEVRVHRAMTARFENGAQLVQDQTLTVTIERVETP